MAVDLCSCMDRQSESRAFSCNVLEKFKRIKDDLVKVQAATKKISAVFLVQVY